VQSIKGILLEDAAKWHDLHRNGLAWRRVCTERFASHNPNETGRLQSVHVHVTVMQAGVAYTTT
jgi:hypothetical protein